MRAYHALISSITWPSRYLKWLLFNDGLLVLFWTHPWIGDNSNLRGHFSSVQVHASRVVSWWNRALAFWWHVWSIAEIFLFFASQIIADPFLMIAHSLLNKAHSRLLIVSKVLRPIPARNRSAASTIDNLALVVIRSTCALFFIICQIFKLRRLGQLQ